jgi:hypothetical protein
MGNNDMAAGMAVTENTATTAPAEDPCPPWCTVKHGGGEHIHSGDISSVNLSLAPLCEDASGMRPDYIAVRLWHEPAEMPSPAVGLQHGDDYLPDMTPAEAVTLALALMWGACRVKPGVIGALAVPGAPVADDGSCPAWCEIAGEHMDHDGGEMRHALVEGMPLTAYPFDVEGVRHLDSTYITRKQVRNGVPAILIEKPDGDADDPDRVMDVPDRQLMLGIGEAVEVAISLLSLAIAPEALLAARAG